MRDLLHDPAAVRAVGLAIGRVVAAKSMAEDARLAKLDELGKITAAESLAGEMADVLTDESRAAISAVVELLGSPL